MKLTIGTRIWTEDDATVHQADHERRGAAWLRLTGQPFNGSAAIVTIDRGDTEEFYCRVGERIFLLSSSWPGESSIYEVTETP